MSRIGRMPVKIPDGVEVTILGRAVTVKGPKGSLTKEVLEGVSVKVDNGSVLVSVAGQDKQSLAYWGLFRAIIANMVKGVTEGFRKDLEIVGVGYRASKKGNGISLSVGYSNPVEFEAPEGITLNVEDTVKISVTGSDKELVGLIAAKIRDVRRPEPYKGKGIRYAGEVVRRKAGKAAAKAAA